MASLSKPSKSSTDKQMHYIGHTGCVSCVPFSVIDHPIQIIRENKNDPLNTDSWSEYASSIPRWPMDVNHRIGTNCQIIRNNLGQISLATHSYYTTQQVEDGDGDGPDTESKKMIELVLNLPVDKEHRCDFLASLPVRVRLPKQNPITKQVAHVHNTDFGTSFGVKKRVLKKTTWEKQSFKQYHQVFQNHNKPPSSLFRKDCHHFPICGIERGFRETFIKNVEQTGDCRWLIMFSCLFHPPVCKPHVLMKNLWFSQVVWNDPDYLEAMIHHLCLMHAQDLTEELFLFCFNRLDQIKVRKPSIWCCVWPLLQACSYKVAQCILTCQLPFDISLIPHSFGHVSWTDWWIQLWKTTLVVSDTPKPHGIDTFTIQPIQPPKPLITCLLTVLVKLFHGTDRELRVNRWSMIANMLMSPGTGERKLPQHLSNVNDFEDPSLLQYLFYFKSTYSTGIKMNWGSMFEYWMDIFVSPSIPTADKTTVVHFLFILLSYTDIWNLSFISLPYKYAAIMSGVMETIIDCPDVGVSKQSHPLILRVQAERIRQYGEIWWILTQKFNLMTLSPLSSPCPSPQPSILSLTPTMDVFENSVDLILSFLPLSDHFKRQELSAVSPDHTVQWKLFQSFEYSRIWKVDKVPVLSEYVPLPFPKPPPPPPSSPLSSLSCPSSPKFSPSMTEEELQHYMQSQSLDDDDDDSHYVSKSISNFYHNCDSDSDTSTVFELD